MNRKLVPLTLVLILLFSMTPLTSGNSNGIYNAGTGCGGSYCHGSNTNAVVSMSGQPGNYTAGQTYTLSISVTGGASSTQGGFSLDVSKGTLSAGGIGIMAVKVNSAGSSATHTTNSYRSWSVDWIAPSTGSGVAILDLAANAADGNGYKSNDNWDTISFQIPEAGTSVSNTPPTASNIQLSPSNPVTTDTLSLTYSYQDSDGDAESGTAIHWYKDGVLESSRDNQLTVPSSLTTKGESWNVTVTPSDGTDDGSAVNSANLLIANSIPYIQSASITPESATESDNLTVGWSSSDADNDILSASGIEWYVDGSKVSAFDNDVTIPSVAIRDGDVWYAKIKVNDGEVDSNWFTTQDITIGSDNTAPTMTSVTLTGLYTTVDDLIATAQGEDLDGDLLTYEWQWPSSTITTPTLPSSLTSKGDSWTAKCRVTDGKTYSDWMESSSVVIQNSAPVLSSVTIDQDSVFFENEATYSYEASDADGDPLSPTESWALSGEILTLQLYVSDNGFSNSQTLSDTVLVANSLPTVTYDGSLTFDALLDIDPSADLVTSDANGDEVTLSWAWIRNGFSTNYNQSTISASNLGAGDTWAALVTPNDGIADGETLVLEFTITNTKPTASIFSTPDAENLIQGATATFSASNSTDIDGAVVNAVWTVDGEIVHTGMVLNILMVEELNLELKVIDDLGATDTLSVSYFGILPPYATNTVAVADGNEILLTWEGNADEWAVVHNGEVIDTTTATKYRHAPTLEGEHSYKILPIVGGQQIQWDGATSTDNAVLESSSVPDTPGPSDTLGMVFSIIMLLAGVVGVTFSFIPRRA